jgi:hypothetical protein
MGVKNFTDIQNSKAFPLQVQNFLTKLEGDKVDMVYQSIFAGKTPIDKGLEDLTTRYNAALDRALQDGEITKEDIIIPGFNYFDYYSKLVTERLRSRPGFYAVREERVIAGRC